MDRLSVGVALTAVFSFHRLLHRGIFEEQRCRYNNFESLEVTQWDSSSDFSHITLEFSRVCFVFKVLPASIGTAVRSMVQYSLVEYFGSSDGSDCGYCRGNEDGSRLTHGMWAHLLSIEVYQSLLDVGWRRSGKYCYKPTMSKTCCPQYTIKCDVTENQLSRGQKKSLKRFRSYIIDGVLPKAGVTATCDDSSNIAQISNKSPPTQNRTASEQPQQLESPSNLPKEKIRDGTQKKKYLRYQRRLEKLRAKSWSDEKIAEHFADKKHRRLEKQKPKQIEDFFDFHQAKCKNNFEVKLVPSADSETFASHLQSEFSVYRSYQTTIHKDKKKELTSKQFERFLVHSPLRYSDLRPDSQHKGGSFHQQYWLNGELIAVGVVDILENCLSSVYLFYDPKYSFLSLGRISALYEIMFTRSIHSAHEDFKYYYMGYYIHSCPKMRYKADYRPSYLLCPETYLWHDVEKAKLLLDQSKYCRFSSPEAAAPTPPDLKHLCVVYQNTAVPYPQYRMMKKKNKEKESEVREFCELVGEKALVQNMFLYRS